MAHVWPEFPAYGSGDEEMKPTFIALLAFCLCIWGCITDKPPLQNPGKKQLRLAADAHQVLVKHCQQCHGKGNSQSDEMFLEYGALIKDKFSDRGMRGDPSSTL